LQNLLAEQFDVDSELEDLEKIIFESSLDLKEINFREIGVKIIDFARNRDATDYFTLNQPEGTRGQILYELIKYAGMQENDQATSVILRELIPVAIVNQDIDTIRELSDYIEECNWSDNFTIVSALRNIAVYSQDGQLVSEFVNAIKRYDTEIGTGVSYYVSLVLSDVTPFHNPDELVQAARIVSTNEVIEVIKNVTTYYPKDFAHTIAYTFTVHSTELTQTDIVNAADIMTSDYLVRIINSGAHDRGYAEEIFNMAIRLKDEALIKQTVQIIEKFDNDEASLGIPVAYMLNMVSLDGKNTFRKVIDALSIDTVTEAILKHEGYFREFRSIIFNGDNLGNNIMNLANIIEQNSNYAQIILHHTEMDELVGLERSNGTGNMKFTWQNPPDSIRWFVLEYHQKYMEELANAEIDLIKRIEPYAGGLTVQDREHRYQTIRQKYLQQPIPDIAKKYVEIEVTNQGVYVNGSLYGGKKEHSDKKIAFDPATELLNRISEYIDPNVSFQVPNRYHPEDGESYRDIINKIRTKLRDDVETHLVYTTLAFPDKSKGTHYIVALDSEDNNLTFAISVRGRRLSTNEDSEHYYGVQRYAVLQNLNGGFKPITSQELLDQISRNSPINAKTVITGLNSN